jgi:hypothetical protein
MHLDWCYTQINQSNKRGDHMAKDNWGGARPGSGRKPGPIKRKPYSFRLSPQEHKQVKSFIKKLKEGINMTTSYKVIEDNGGGLHLVVFERGKVIYLCSGFEYGTRGRLLDAIQAIKDGDHPIKDGWDGNDDDPKASYDKIISYEYGWKVVADNDGIYPDKMGSAATIEFIGYDREMFAGMIDDWLADHAPEYDDLEIDEPEINENGVWEARAQDGKHTYTLTDDGAGNIVINYSSTK